MPRKRRVCFVTGTRAEFGLMRTALEAIAAHPKLQLQILVTGMHLAQAHGRGVKGIRQEGWRVDGVVAWPNAADAATLAAGTGTAMAGIARELARLDSDVVLVVGDRVEAFAAASAGHLSRRIVTHVHGGDRALGQVDDALRHAITKLSHVHFPATIQSAQRIMRLGEERWRIFRVGSPGNDAIRRIAAPWRVIALRWPMLQRHRYALAVLHPAQPAAKLEYAHAAMLAENLDRAGFPHVVVIHPNNDPGAAGIIRYWQSRGGDPRYLVCPDAPRDVFLGLMRDAGVLVGNTSAGIIEAATFGTPVIDIGPRQAGRQHSRNVRHVDYDDAAIHKAIRRVGTAGQPRRCRCVNVYGGGGAGRRMADIIAQISLDDRLRTKLIRY